MSTRSSFFALVASAIGLTAGAAQFMPTSFARGTYAGASSTTKPIVLCPAMSWYPMLDCAPHTR